MIRHGWPQLLQVCGGGCADSSALLGTAASARVSGNGYVELTGYAERRGEEGAVRVR